MSHEIATPEVVEAAERRLAAFLEDVAHLDGSAFAQTALSRAALADARAAARADADRIAREVGLDALATDARACVRAHIVRTYDDALYRPTMVGLNWGLSEGTVEDRIAAMMAAEDAVTAAVLEPYLSDHVLELLTSPFELITRSQAIDASFDMTRATARAVGSAGPARWTQRWPLLLVVLVALLATVTGWWPVAVIVVLAAAIVGWFRSRHTTAPSTD